MVDGQAPVLRAHSHRDLLYEISMKADDADSKVQQPNCWDYKYNDLTGTSFFGRRTWFERHAKDNSKEIPQNIVDKGCKFFEPGK